MNQGAKVKNFKWQLCCSTVFTMEQEPIITKLIV